MFSVRDKAVHHEGMYQTKECLLDITERIEMPTERNGVVDGENGVGCIRFHKPEIKGQLYSENNLIVLCHSQSRPRLEIYCFDCPVFGGVCHVKFKEELIKVSEICKIESFAGGEEQPPLYPTQDIDIGS
jgi:hypothetical protein